LGLKGQLKKVAKKQHMKKQCRFPKF
jgi:hypothetical protein